MDNRFSRVKSPTARAPQKNGQYKRGDIIAGLDPRRDYRGVSHYFTPDGTTIFTFFVKGQHGNNWNRPVFTYTAAPVFPEDKKDGGQTRHVFYHDDDCGEGLYNYLGTTADEKETCGKIAWDII